jgi:hypothetical protein
MPQRSLVTVLPEEVKAALDQKMIRGGFGDYEGLSEWLAEQGYQISKSSLHRYGSRFEERLGALALASEQAKAIATAAQDDGNAMSDALIRLYQEKIFELLMNMGEIDPENMDLSRLGATIAKLSDAGVKLKKLQAEVQEKAQKAAEEVDKILQPEGKGGLSEDMATQIRAKILGIAA